MLHPYFLFRFSSFRRPFHFHHSETKLHTPLNNINRCDLFCFLAFGTSFARRPTKQDEDEAD
ncbi:unnamed protein product [Amoebophrya sp. A120]|nr:unnamed protein product [Amoebophrya sp. A120]|eukprot:GSA120T00001903001.1